MPQPVDVIVSNSVNELARLKINSLRSHGAHDQVDNFESAKSEIQARCINSLVCGLSSGGVVSIFFTKRLAFPEQNLRRTIAHEIAHEIQVQFIGNYRGRLSARERIKKRGPIWLTEALALALEISFLFKDNKLKQLDIYNRWHTYQSDRLKKFDIIATSNADDFYDYATLAGLLLLSRSSEQAILDFWEKTPELGWEASFEQAFGLTVDEFYDKFWKLVRPLLNFRQSPIYCFITLDMHKFANSALYPLT